ncbi:hypothetical protein HEP89_23095 [Labrenzia sp. 5N]|uniref:hypothetical protein n=1 Tax=Labrenzia sp. 5N TaxID=2723402 RepID=UPI0014459D9E|nr:hypothetical protein [Labrenzia sp. 5N]NKX67013.1 hypothetical protein [Labrenzia sp. 5N]
MRTFREILPALSPVWLYFVGLGLLALGYWIMPMDWSGIREISNWMGIFGTLAGALVTVSGAYLIARYQIKPLLQQNISAETKAFIDRAKECSAISEEIFNFQIEIIEITKDCSFISEDNEKLDAVYALPQWSKIKAQAQRIENFSVQADLRIRRLPIYPDTNSEVIKVRQQYRSTLEEVESIMSKLCYFCNSRETNDISKMKELSKRAFTEIIKYADCTYLMINALEEEQNRLEGLIRKP